MDVEGDAGGAELYLYMVADDDEVISLLQNGLLSPTTATSDEDDNCSSDDWVFLFSNPLAALQFYKGTIGELEPLSDDETEGANYYFKSICYSSTVYLWSLLSCRQC
ncbi:hypothetical protein PF008_g32093 [Phytophthora fragariae]|uniref:Uncharacterized protein n=1 Tax=Phytophthora fragariae TaxID=53985 RepID=A0A6G0Q0X9_9STRA|nr:hypothetical protein PF008_g32093 [Phytophthora fragariae]